MSPLEALIDNDESLVLNSSKFGDFIKKYITKEMRNQNKK